ncbi:hypothetical protein Bca101_094949 [Brassica carinata]
MIRGSVTSANSWNPILNAWTRVAILTVEGTRVTRPTRLHRFLTPPAIQPSDPPANSELHRFVTLHLEPSLGIFSRRESIAVARSHPPPLNNSTQR